MTDPNKRWQFDANDPEQLERFVREVLDLDADADLSLTQYREPEFKGDRPMTKDDRPMTKDDRPMTEDDELLKSALDLGGQVKEQTDQTESEWLGLDHDQCPFSGEARLKEWGPAEAHVWQVAEDVEGGVFIESFSLDDTTEDGENFRRLMLQAKTEYSAVSYACLRTFVWVFALDQPVSQSRRGLVMVWLGVHAVRLWIEYQKVKAGLRSIFKI